MKKFFSRVAIVLVTLCLIGAHPFFVSAGGGLALSSAIVSGSVLTLTYNESLDPNSIPDIGTFMSDFTVDVNNSPVGLQNISITNDTVVIILSNPVMVTDAVTIDYTPDSNPLVSLSGDQANSFSGQVVTTTPSAPFPINSSSLNPVAVSSSEIDLTWSGIYDGGSAITGYEIDRSVGGGPGGGGATFYPIAHPGPNDTSFSDTGLLPGTQYNYEIIATNAIGPGTPLVAADIPTEASFSGGDGSPDNPFQITTCAQFEELTNAQPIGAHFLVEKDLDCTGEGNAITISTLPYFMGRVDGGGHRITIATTDGEGLFHATGNFFVLKNLWVAGTITGATGNTGGVIDSIQGGSISKVKSTVAITGSGTIGGIAGTLELPSATIEDSYFNGTIHAGGSADKIGGIVGRVIRGISITNSYSAGTITETGANAFIGGIWGYSIASFTGYPANDFSAIAMNATGSNETIGGLFGFVGQEYSGYVNNFWDVTTTGQLSCFGGGPSAGQCSPENTGGTSADYFKNNSTNGPFPAWDFGSTWKTVVGEYPELGGLGIDPTVTSVNPSDGATGVILMPQLVVNFSEPMDPNSLIVASSPCSDSGCLQYSNVWSNGNQTVTLTPTTSLLANTQYHAEISSASSADGFSLTSPFSWSFTTMLPANPIIKGASVSGGGCGSGLVWNSQSQSCVVLPIVSVSSPVVNLQAPVVSAVIIPSVNQLVKFSNPGKILRYGMNTNDVIVLQQYLNDHHDTVATTGVGSVGHEGSYFGLLTENAVKKFQKLHGLIPDGVVGAKTKSLMI